jgi:hypothetical protein
VVFKSNLDFSKQNSKLKGAKLFKRILAKEMMIRSNEMRLHYVVLIDKYYFRK